MNHEMFLQRYELALATHSWEAIEPLIDDDACFLFSDGTFIGKAAIEKAIRKTFALISNESYWIQNVQWVYVHDDCALCTYIFHWSGVIDGAQREGDGRGTTLLANTMSGWKIKHEHLGPSAG